MNTSKMTLRVKKSIYKQAEDNKSELIHDLARYHTNYGQSYRERLSTLNTRTRLNYHQAMEQVAFRMILSGINQPQEWMIENALDFDTLYTDKA